MCIVWVFTHLIPLKLLITLWNKDRNYYPYSIEKESLRLQDNLLTTGLWGGFPGGTVVKPLPASAGDEMQVQSLGLQDPLEKEMATHSSILAWDIPWTEEPGGLQSIGPQSRSQLSM